MITAITIYANEKQTMSYEAGKYLMFGDKKSDIKVEKIKKSFLSNEYHIVLSNKEKIIFRNVAMCITTK